MSNYLYENMANSNNESGSLSCLPLNAYCMGSNIYGQTRGPVGDCCPGTYCIADVPGGPSGLAQCKYGVPPPFGDWPTEEIKDKCAIACDKCVGPPDLPPWTPLSQTYPPGTLPIIGLVWAVCPRPRTARPATVERVHYLDNIEGCRADKFATTVSTGANQLDQHIYHMRLRICL